MKVNTLWLLFASLLLSGCGNDSNQSQSISGIKEILERYSNNAELSFNDLNIKVFDFANYRTQDSNWYFCCRLSAVNASSQTRMIPWGDAKIIRESNQAEYSVGGLMADQMRLESGIVNTYLLTSTLPTSYDSECYMFQVRIESTLLRVHLYEPV